MKVARYMRLFMCSIVLTVMSGCAYSPWEKSPVKGDKPEERIESAKQIENKHPDSAIARKDFFLTNEEEVNKLMADADAERAAKHWDAAMAAYDRVLAVSPNNNRAIDSKKLMRRDIRNAKYIDDATTNRKISTSLY